jgi:hypothetical protein
LIKISKYNPHKRICICCGNSGINTVLCSDCKHYIDFIPSADYLLVKLFYEYPAISELRKEFNFKSHKTVIRHLYQLNVPVKKYTLGYFLHNRQRFSTWSIQELTKAFRFETSNPIFLIYFYTSLEDPKKVDKYKKIYTKLANNYPLRTLSKESGIYRPILKSAKFYLDK